MSKADVGLVGLAVMGENLVLNMESKGFTVAVFNRTVSKVDDFVNGRAKGKNILGAHSVEEFVSLLKRPRKVMIMVKAGKAVDDFIEQILPHLEPGDILIDGGNTHYPDTIRRTAYVESKGMLYVGTGVSGGEEGALKGPSIMPGGSPAAWPQVKPIFQAIAAKTDDGTPCCDWVGENGAGHFVKMVHNGIEYGDMQLICEAYDILKNVLGMSAFEMHDVFAEWNKGELDSYLIEITRDILGFKDEDGQPLVDRILDTAGPEGHRQVDGDRGARARHPAHPHRRGGLRPLPLGHQGRACRRLEGARRPDAEVRGRPQGLRRGRPARPSTRPRWSRTRRATR